MLIFFHSAKNGKGWTYGDLKMNFLYYWVCSKIGIYGVTKPWVKQIREFLRAFTYCYCMSVWIIIACLQLLLPFARRCDLCVWFTNLTWVVWISGNVTNLWGILGGGEEVPMRPKSFRVVCGGFRAALYAGKMTHFNGGKRFAWLIQACLENVGISSVLVNMLPVTLFICGIWPSPRRTWASRTLCSQQALAWKLQGSCISLTHGDPCVVCVAISCNISSYRKQQDHVLPLTVKPCWP